MCSVDLSEGGLASPAGMGNATSLGVTAPIALARPAGVEGAVRGTTGQPDGAIHPPGARDAGSDSRAPSDTPANLSAEERIREAAIAAFAAEGFKKPTIRAIAEAAGVSAALVMHHFGSKAKLRRACDDYAFQALTDLKATNAAQSPLEITALMMQEPSQTHLLYVVASMLDPSPDGQRFFDHYVEVIEQALKEGFEGYHFRGSSDDVRGRAVTIATTALGPVLLETRARHSLETDNLVDSFVRMTPHIMDLYINGFFSSLPAAQSSKEQS